MIFGNLKFIWDNSSAFAKIAVAFMIAIMIFAVVGGTYDKEKRTARTSFCLERGYDGYKISDGKYYCWNTVNGEIKRFRDPVQ